MDRRQTPGEFAKEPRALDVQVRQPHMYDCSAVIGTKTQYHSCQFCQLSATPAVVRFQPLTRR